MIQKLFILTLFFIVAFNVYAPLHLYNELYDIVVLKKTIPAIFFLSQLKGTDHYVRQQQFLSEYLPSDFSMRLEIDRTKTQNNIMKLNAYYIINQKQPQILYLLSKAYRDMGNKIEAEKYMKDARAIDPFITP